MTNIIRSVAGIFSTIFLILLMFKIFGDVGHRKAVAVLFIAAIGGGVIVFYNLLDYSLNTPAKRITGALSVLVAVLYSILVINSGIDYTISRMTSRYSGSNDVLYWFGLLLTSLMPWLAFKYDALVLPVVDWLSAKEK